MEFALSELIDQVMTARAGHRPMFIVGGGTKNFLGNTHTITPIDGHCVLDMSVLNGVIDYHPAELVLTARAGTPLTEIEAVLAAENQMLAFEPPHFGSAATIGGCVAAGLSGPARMANGSVRDFVLGAHLLDSQGRELAFGGQVVKNVAGYDVSRLLVGAMGIFGAITEVSIKVAPKPRCRVTVALECDAQTALAYCAGWRVLPLPISATAWVGSDAGGAQGGTLWVRLSGSDVAVSSASRSIGGQVMDVDTADVFWQSLREQTHSFFAGPEPLWRMAMPAAAPIDPGFECELIEWGGAQRWWRGEHAVEAMRAHAVSKGGHATLFRTGARGERPASGVFHPPESTLLNVMQRLKNEFDPWHLFNPGRLLQET